MSGGGGGGVQRRRGSLERRWRAPELRRAPMKSGVGGGGVLVRCRLTRGVKPVRRREGVRTVTSGAAGRPYGGGFGRSTTAAAEAPP